LGNIAQKGVVISRGLRTASAGLQEYSDNSNYDDVKQDNISHNVHLTILSLQKSVEVEIRSIPATERQKRMSRWLSSVNNLLEKLDDRVETVVEERAFANETGEEIKQDDAIGDILTKRGLSFVLSKDDDEDEVQYDEEHGIDAEEKSGLKDDNNYESNSPMANADPAQVTANDAVEVDDIETGRDNVVVNYENNEGNIVSSEKLSDESSFEKSKAPDNDIAKSLKVPQNNVSTNSAQEPSNKAVEKPLALFKNASKMQSQPPSCAGKVATPPKKPASASSRPITSAGGTPSRSQKEKELTTEMKEAQKEARTLRRHVVSLNEQLEAAKYELQAQRKELERAAERMEKDRVRSKQEKEASLKQHAQELSLLKSQYETTLKEQQIRFEEQLEGYRQKLSEEECKRKQEGGDWTKEMAQAFDREKAMRQKVDALEEEKAVLLSQISTLQGQQVALGSRLESLTQAADNAMER
jgi:hypothetical protein